MANWAKMDIIFSNICAYLLLNLKGLLKITLINNWIRIRNYICTLIPARTTRTTTGSNDRCSVGIDVLLLIPARTATTTTGSNDWCSVGIDVLLLIPARTATSTSGRNDWCNNAWLSNDWFSNDWFRNGRGNDWDSNDRNNVGNDVLFVITARTATSTAFNNNWGNNFYDIINSIIDILVRKLRLRR
jgi:hypothetical protein